MEFDEMDFTENAWEALYDAVDSSYFKDQDADLIYQTLESRLRFIPFGEYLKRYIYRNAQMEEPYESVPVKIYQQIIRDSFADNHTPPSFIPTTAKIGALSKNWLTQQTVKRNVVFLLGFGLAMNPEDIHQFLTKALREQGINAKSPFEVICWYCYKNGYGYLKFEKLWRIYESTPPNSLDMSLLYGDATIGARNTMYSIYDDAALIAFVSKLKTTDNQTKGSVTAKRWFDRLYDEARDLIAAMYNDSEEERQRENVLAYQRRLAGSDRFYDYEKRQMLEQKREQGKIYHRDDISESDMEHIICAAIPVDRHGNLTSGKASKLNGQFAGKRFSRHHIRDVLLGKAEVSRFDLITLNFFVYSQKLDSFANVKKRYESFISSMNRILDECYLGPLYVANPYECFILMCILSEDPMGTYADVWEMSYSEAAQE